jgi:hypothetical protein
VLLWAQAVAKELLPTFKGAARRSWIYIKWQCQDMSVVLDKVICLIYVDDTLLFSLKKEYIDQVIQELKVDFQMDLEIESNVSGFLGVHVERHRATGSITLTQHGITKQIINILNIGSFLLVQSHKQDGNPPQGLYSYASVIGMLLCLANHKIPDILFAVAQCAY